MGPRQRDEMRQLGLLRITDRLLESMLDLPDDAQIINVFVENKQAGILGLIIKSPWMPMVPEGATIPHVSLEEVRGWDG